MNFLEDELQFRMQILYEKQHRCLKVQKVFIFLSIVFFICAIVLLPVHFLFALIVGGPMANKATSLAREKYPYVRIAWTGTGSDWNLPLIIEAERFNDYLTVEILKFNSRSLQCFATAMLGNILMWWIMPRILLRILSAIKK